jgi:tetratricopeptide (TPR) repeat protein
VGKLVEIQPDSADNWILMGQLMFGMKKYPDACVAFEKATTLNPKRADVWGMKAAALVHAGKHAEALTAANKGVGISPADPSAIYNRGCIYSLMGDKINALADLQKAIQLNPQLKQHARTDEDFKNLWNDEVFINLTK